MAAGGGPPGKLGPGQNLLGGQKGQSAAPLTAAAAAAAMRMDAVNAIARPSERNKRSTRLLDMHDIENEVAAAERTLEMGEEKTYTLTQAASRKRAELQQVLDAEKQHQEEQMDERLVASQEAIDAFQRAADAAKRNARRLTAVLEREQSIGMGGAGRNLLEQRVGAANAAAKLGLEAAESEGNGTASAPSAEMGREAQQQQQQQQQQQGDKASMLSNAAP